MPCPKDSERIRDGPYGLEIFSGNRFLVERALLDSVGVIRQYADVASEFELPLESSFPAKGVRERLHTIVRGSVVNNFGERYSYYGDPDEEFMHFGSHAICDVEFVDELWAMLECHRIFV